MNISMEHKHELGHKEPARLETQQQHPTLSTPPQNEQEISFFNDFIAGGVAGSASVVVGHPMDTLKVRMQTSKGNPSLWSLATGSKYGGPSSLFRGMTAPLSTACVVNAIIFSSYGWSTRLYEERYNAQESSLKTFVCGSFAGLVQALVICPMEHIKCRLQIQEVVGTTAALSSSNNNSANASHPLRTTLRTILKSGSSSFNVVTLYRGWCITCWREIPAFGAYFTLYDIFKDRIRYRLDQREVESGQSVVDGIRLTTVPIETRSATVIVTDPDTAATLDTTITNHATMIAVDSGGNQHNAHMWIASAVAGGLTGALTWAMVYPFDVIKTQIQTSPIDTPKNERTIAAVVTKIVKERGWKHLFRGLTVTCLRAFPVNGIIFPVYEYTLLHVCAWEA
mmetsp:Transcript_32874/g.36607  ORF Transcript_32874/g.36607 Transcript_32874/m.36607 type:complete len:396 (+) Transcript_32874:1-1188(+)